MTQPAERLLDYGFAGREMTDTDARLCHTWLRINRVLRVMLDTLKRDRGSRAKRP